MVATFEALVVAVLQSESEEALASASAEAACMHADDAINRVTYGNVPVEKNRLERRPISAHYGTVREAYQSLCDACCDVATSSDDLISSFLQGPARSRLPLFAW